MSKFKVGDRVVVYDSGIQFKGKVFEVFGDGLEVIADHTLDSDMYHEKQLRKLKPKNPRRRVWITDATLWKIDYDGSTTALVSNRKVVSEDVEFVEVRRKKGAK